MSRAPESRSGDHRPQLADLRESGSIEQDADLVMTGSTGAGAAAVARGLAKSPLCVLTPAGPLDLRLEQEVYLSGPAEIVAAGEFYLEC